MLMVVMVVSTFSVKAQPFEESVEWMAEATCDKGIDCLAQAVYFEARGEVKAGQVAVAQVIMNRVHSPKYPNSIKEVVWQPKQFSYTHDGKHERMLDQVAKAKAYDVAHFVLNYGQFFDSMEGSDHYYAHKLANPVWKDKMVFVAQIGNHSFYRSK